MRTARAKGLTERRVLVQHVLRTSMITFVSLFGLDFGALVGRRRAAHRGRLRPARRGQLTYDSLAEPRPAGDHGDRHLRLVLRRHGQRRRRHPLRHPRSAGASCLSEPLLEVRDLRVSFRTEDGLVRAVDGVSFSVGAGEVLGIVGESGSGKSVTAMSMMRLIRDPNAIIEGEVLYKGRDLLKLSPTQMREVRGSRDRDDLPGSDDLAQPGLPRRLADRRADPGPREASRSAEARKRVDRAAAARSASRSPSGASTTTRTSSRAACASA